MMGCPCDQTQLLGGLMGALDPIHAGEFFALSLEIDVKCYSASGCVWTLANERELAAALNESDYASGVTVYQLSGWVNPYIVIEGYSGAEFGSAGHLKQGVLDTITAAGYLYDAGSVRFTADTYNPATGASTSTRVDNPAGGSVTNAPPPPSDPNKKSFLDQLAIDLGIDKQTAQYVLIGGAVLAIALIAKR